MKALTWQGKRKLSVETVPDPTLQQDTDAIIEVTSTGICGSDLHLYEVLGPFMTEGDVIGHEPMGRVVEAGSASGLTSRSAAAGSRRQPRPRPRLTCQPACAASVGHSQRAVSGSAIRQRVVPSEASRCTAHAVPVEAR